MATQSPFSLQPPPWVVDEAQRRIVLLLNHVLMQEPAAPQRLLKQMGRVVLFQWREFTLQLIVTPAGLLDRAPASTPPELTLAITQESPLHLLQGLLRGERPSVRIEGDVQLAADINWLADNVRWDVEEDLSRIIGDAPAHAVAQGASRMLAALRQFVARRTGAAP